MSRLSIAALVTLSGMSIGCTYEDVRHDDHQEGPPINEQPVPTATIDTGSVLAEIEPGRGVGAFVEYAGGGQWHIYTACDTELSSYGCTWDIIVSVGEDADISQFEAENLEASDYLDWESAREVQLFTSTTYDLDGFWLDSTPGAPLRVDVYLDGRPAERYIYWVGDGALHRGAPSNPIDLIPSSP